MLRSGVRVRRRGHRSSADDRGAAVEAAGRPDGWLDVARRVAEGEYWLNVNRDGTMFVPAADLAWLALRLADASRARDELFDLDAR